MFSSSVPPGTLTRDGSGLHVVLLIPVAVNLCVSAREEKEKRRGSHSLTHTHAEVTSTAPRPVTVVVPAKKLS